MRNLLLPLAVLALAACDGTQHSKDRGASGSEALTACDATHPCAAGSCVQGFCDNSGSNHSQPDGGVEAPDHDGDGGEAGEHDGGEVEGHHDGGGDDHGHDGGEVEEQGDGGGDDHS